MHISSLPSAYGIGNLGREAYAFIDFLKKANQSYWQILPICPPGYGDSPYQAFSTFAGNPYFIDPDDLVEKGWLTQEELAQYSWGERPDQVDFRRMYEHRTRLLHTAFCHFRHDPPADFEAYVEQEGWWLREYALFMAVKGYYNDGPWTQWPLDIRLHQPEAMREYGEHLRDDVEYQYFVQYVFSRQWNALRAYARAGHPDHRRRADLCPAGLGGRVGKSGELPAHAHAPSALRGGLPARRLQRQRPVLGQPIYDWERMEPRRLFLVAQAHRRGRTCFSMLRIDHFRGIESCGHPTCRQQDPRATGAGVKKDPDSSWCARDSEERIGYLVHCRGSGLPQRGGSAAAVLDSSWPV